MIADPARLLGSRQKRTRRRIAVMDVYAS